LQASRTIVTFLLQGGTNSRRDSSRHCVVLRCWLTRDGESGSPAVFAVVAYDLEQEAAGAGKEIPAALTARLLGD
jgi:hypothetical protein